MASKDLSVYTFRSVVAILQPATIVCPGTSNHVEQSPWQMTLLAPPYVARHRRRGPVGNPVAAAKCLSFSWLTNSYALARSVSKAVAL